MENLIRYNQSGGLKNPNTTVRINPAMNPIIIMNTMAKLGVLNFNLRRMISPVINTLANILLIIILLFIF